jgi:ATP-dependent Lon protease
MTSNQAIPLFPLELVLYPDEEMPLHIFEPKYREMVEDCLATEMPFGVVLSQDGNLSEVGCAAEIVRVVQDYDDGRRDILVRGGFRFKILGLGNQKAYMTADVLEVIDSDKNVAVLVRERVIAQHIKLLELAGRMPTPTQYQDRAFLSYFIAHNTGLNVEQKQELLELMSENERLDFLVAHLEKFIPMVEEVETLRQKVRSNGHFRDFPPPADDSAT